MSWIAPKNGGYSFGKGDTRATPIPPRGGGGVGGLSRDAKQSDYVMLCYGPPSEMPPRVLSRCPTVDPDSWDVGELPRAIAREATR